MPRTAPIRTALVGLGGYGRTHLALLLEAARAGRARAVAAVSINPAADHEAIAALREVGAEIFPSFDPLLAERATELDLLLLPTPIPLHRPMAEAALVAGLHALLEKPLAGSPADAEAIVAADAASAGSIAVGFQDLYAEPVQALKRLLVDGALGRLTAIRGAAVWPRDTAYYARSNWAGRLRVGGADVFDSPFNNAMSHFLMLTLFLAGEAFSSAAEIADETAELYRARPIESFDTAVWRARTSKGVTLAFVGTHSAFSHRAAELTILTERARVTWRHEARCTIHWHDGRTEDLGGMDPLAVRTRMIDQILRRVAGEETFICPPALALAHTRLVARLHARFPIRDVHPDFLEHRHTPTGVQVGIRDVEAALDRACRENLPLAAPDGAAWAS